MSAAAENVSSDTKKAAKDGDQVGAEDSQPVMHEVLSKAGLVYSEFGNLSEVLCKPKVLAIKSHSLQKIEEMERKMREGGAAEGV